MKKLIVTLFLIVISLQALAEDVNESKWFKNETSCAGHKIFVRSYCDTSISHNGTHSFCDYQKITITDAKNHSVTTDLLEKDALVADGPRFLSAVRCGITTDKTPYLLMILDNRGNCDTCEVSGVMDLKGVWRNYDKFWFNTKKAEKKKIDNLKWRQFEEFYIKNAILDERQN